MAAESITFRGAYIRYIDIRQSAGGGDLYTKVHMAADWSQPVAERMGWGEIGDGLTAGDLAGELLGANMTLTPGDKTLRRQEINFEVQEVGNFCFALVNNGPTGEDTSKEIRFQVKTSALEAATNSEQYLRLIGKHKGSLKISYTKQEELDLNPEAGKEQ